jgi:tripartite-type tricarboxylate transporter receptor subunit TctC
METGRSGWFAVLSFVSLLGICLTPAQGADVSFKGKRINALIGSSPGGGTDTGTRLVGRFLQQYLPGKPQLVYRNMPAGQGIKALNYFAKEAARDGTYWIAAAGNSVDAVHLMQKDIVEYDPRTFQYIGGISRGGSVVIVRKTKLSTISRAGDAPVVVGELDGSRGWAQMIQWGAEYLGWNIRFVIGYPSSGALLLALRRGEIDAFGTSTITMHRTLEKTAEFTGLVQIGDVQGGKIVPRMAFPNVPTIPHLLEGKLSGLAKEAFEYWVKTTQIDKWYALPPRTPGQVVEAYRSAFEAAMKDPELIKSAKLQFSEDFAPQAATDVADLIGSTAYPQPEILGFLRELRVKHGLPAVPLTPEQMAKLATARGGTLQVETRLDKVVREGREIVFKNAAETHKAKISSSRTKVLIKDKEAKRGALAPGMICRIVYAGDGADAMEVHCN